MTLRLIPAGVPATEASRKADDLPALPIAARNGPADFTVAFGFAVERATACPHTTGHRAICAISPDRRSMRVRVVDSNGDAVAETGTRVTMKSY
jgi:hypothetical protein